MPDPEVHRLDEFRSIPWGRLPPLAYRTEWDISCDDVHLSPGSFAVRIFAGGVVAEIWELPQSIGSAIKEAREGLRTGLGRD